MEAVVLFSGTTDYCAKAAATFKGSWTHFVQTLPESCFLAAVDDLLHSLSNQMPNKGQPERILEDIIMATGKLASKKNHLPSQPVALRISSEITLRVSIKSIMDRFCSNFAWTLKLAYWPLLMICYISITIKDHIRATAAIKCSYVIMDQFCFNFGCR